MKFAGKCGLHACSAIDQLCKLIFVFTTSKTVFVTNMLGEVRTQALHCISAGLVFAKHCRSAEGG